MIHYILSDGLPKSYSYLFLIIFPNMISLFLVFKKKFSKVFVLKKTQITNIKIFKCDIYLIYLLYCLSSTITVISPQYNTHILDKLLNNTISNINWKIWLSLWLWFKNSGILNCVEVFNSLSQTKYSNFRLFWIYR